MTNRRQRQEIRCWEANPREPCPKVGQGMWENNLTRPRDHVHAPEGARGPPGLTWINFNKYSITGVTRVCTRLHHRRCSGQRKHQPRTRRDRCDVWCGRKHHLWASTGLVMESWSQLLGLSGLFPPSGYTEIRSRPSGPNRPNLDQKWAKACGKTI